MGLIMALTPFLFLFELYLLFLNSFFPARAKTKAAGLFMKARLLKFPGAGPDI
jgi:hypothetical protein